MQPEAWQALPFNGTVAWEFDTEQYILHRSHRVEALTAELQQIPYCTLPPVFYHPRVMARPTLADGRVPALLTPNTGTCLPLLGGIFRL